MTGYVVTPDGDRVAAPDGRIVASWWGTRFRATTEATDHERRYATGADPVRIALRLNLSLREAEDAATPAEPGINRDMWDTPDLFES